MLFVQNGAKTTITKKVNKITVNKYIVYTLKLVLLNHTVIPQALLQLHWFSTVIPNENSFRVGFDYNNNAY